METEIGVFIWLTALAMFTLAAAIVIFHINYRANMLKLEKEKQILAFKAAIEAEENQKERIANNLHDEVIPLMIVIGQHADLPREDSNAVISELVSQSINSIRAIALDLIPKTLLNFGLIKALEQRARFLNSGSNSVVELENNTRFEQDAPFTKNEQVNIYRMCLEILNNLNKHTGYTYLRITIESSNKHLNIIFTHDGRGVSDKDIEAFGKTTAGLGLKSLQSRSSILGASIRYSVDLDAATIQLSIPFSNER